MRRRGKFGSASHPTSLGLIPTHPSRVPSPHPTCPPVLSTLTNTHRGSTVKYSIFLIRSSEQLGSEAGLRSMTGSFEVISLISSCSDVDRRVALVVDPSGSSCTRKVELLLVIVLVIRGHRAIQMVSQSHSRINVDRDRRPPVPERSDHLSALVCAGDLSLTRHFAIRYIIGCYSWFI